MNRNTQSLPLVPLRDVVIFPNTSLPLYVGRGKSLRAINKSQSHDQELVLVAQRNPLQNDPGAQDLYSVGTKVRIKQFSKLADGNVKLIIDAIEPVRILSIDISKPHLSAEIEPFVLERSSDVVEQKWTTNLLVHAESYFKITSRSFSEVAASARSIANPHDLVHFLATQINLKVKDRQELLEKTDIIEKIELLSTLLLGEIELLSLDRKIKDQVREKMEKTQKEFFLNEQMAAIQRELGNDHDPKEEISALETRLKEKDLPQYARERATKELKRLRQAHQHSPETGIIRNYVELILDLPWNAVSKDQTSLKAAEDVLEKDHFGLKDVKDRILDFLAVRSNSPTHRSPIVCFVGPPGVGKTSLAKSIATSLGRKFEKISLGGLRDEAELRGHRRTYIAALPGKILSSLKKAGTSNPVILLDEIDKVGADFRGDPASALLEILDSEQNKHFGDHYLDLEYDLSKVLFVATANTIDTISPPLRDRMEVISLNGYSEPEKIAIAQRYLIPREVENHGIDPKTLTLEAKELSFIIQNYTRESGVRGLQREIAKLCRKAVRDFAQDFQSTKLDIPEIEKKLGRPKFRRQNFGVQSEIGMVTGLAWTSFGGELLAIEANVLPGRGRIQITGKLGEVMQESVKAAISYIRSRAHEWGIDPEYFSSKDIHVHVPEGATPKDGPSAGIAMVTAILSAVLKVPVSKEIGMTGEITLRGKILPIGGLKEKMLAAQRGGLREVFYPIENERDKDEFISLTEKEIQLFPVSDMEEILHRLFSKELKSRDYNSGFYINEKCVGSPLGPSSPLL